jgi:hypothetical protein
MLRHLTVLALFVSAHVLANESYRDRPCKTPELVPACIQVHARLWAGNGTPSTRLWPIGTHHIYGIFSNRYGFVHDETTLDNEAPELHFRFPKNMPDQTFWTVYGDFEVCPLEPLKQGHMQAACIAGATHIVAATE